MKDYKWTINDFLCHFPTSDDTVETLEQIMMENPKHTETSNKLFNNGKKIRHYTSYSYQKPENTRQIYTSFFPFF